MSPATLRKAVSAVLYYRRGWLMERIAEKLGVSIPRISQYLDALNEPARHRGPAADGPKVMRVRNKVAKLWPELGTSGTADELGISVSTVTRHAHKLGLPVKLGRLAAGPDPEPRECRCGCGTVFTPTRSDVANGTGWYVDVEHFRVHLAAARTEFDQQTVWTTIEGAADVLVLRYQAIRQYLGLAGRGRVRLRPVLFDDVPELEHLSVLGIQYVIRMSEVQALRRQLLAEYHVGSGPRPELVAARYSEEAQRIWDGKLAAFTARANDKTPGRPRMLAEHEEDEIIRRYNVDRQSQEVIGEAMSVSRKVVRGVIERHRAAA